MSIAYHYLNEDFSTVARAAVRACLSHVDEVPHLIMTHFTDPPIGDGFRSFQL